jgi:hypothetical protein
MFEHQRRDSGLVELSGRAECRDPFQAAIVRYQPISACGGSDTICRCDDLGLDDIPG